MNEEILKRIDVLAEKLGTTATHVYQTYVAQARVAAIQDIILIMVFGAIAISFGFWARKLFRDGESSEVPIVMLFVGAIIAFWIVIFSVTGVVTEIGNPEYWAVHHIADDLKSSTK